MDKANFLPASKTWRDVVAGVASEYPEIDFEQRYVDTTSFEVMRAPHRFDVVLTENLFGDILSDQLAALVGSMSLLGAASLGTRGHIFRPVQDSDPEIAGRGIANPAGAILAVALMLEHVLERPDLARVVEAAVADSSARGQDTRRPRTRHDRGVHARRCSATSPGCAGRMSPRRSPPALRNGACSAPQTISAKSTPSQSDETLRTVDVLSSGEVKWIRCFRDIEYGARVLLKRPLITLIAGLSLALGIGANTTIFSLVNALFLQGLPVQDSERLVSIHTTGEKVPGLSGLSHLNWKDYREQSDAFEQIAAYDWTAISVSIDG